MEALQIPYVAKLSGVACADTARRLHCKSPIVGYFIAVGSAWNTAVDLVLAAFRRMLIACGPGCCCLWAKRKSIIETEEGMMTMLATQMKNCSVRNNAANNSAARASASLQIDSHLHLFTLGSAVEHGLALRCEFLLLGNTAW